MILAQRGITAFSYGENVAIFIEDYNGDQCRVEVVSKRAMETNVFAPDWSRSLFTYLDSKFK
jgi:urocanate hydratase